MKLVDAISGLEYELPTMVWTDEFTWTKAIATVQWTLGGKVVVQEGVRVSGRPITLEGPDNEMGWMKLSQVLLLQAVADLADRKLQLVIGSGATQRTKDVTFNHSVVGFEAKPLFNWQDREDPDSYYNVTLRMLEV